MKKILLCLLVLVMVFTLISCGGKTNLKDYADKINAAAATENTGDDYTYKQITKDLGDGTGLLLAGTGTMMWVDNDTAITITFVNNVACGAICGEASF